jgi:hypothetical protein
MRTRTRYLLALMVVATALCAGRATATLERVDKVPTRGLVDRLAEGFRRTVATRPVVRQRCPWSAVTTVRPVTAPVVTVAAIVPPTVCPACLPQPPPC